MKRLPRLVLVLVLGLLSSGCASLVDRATNQFADDLERAIRGHDDPATVASALPAYLLLLEARLQGRPDDARLHLTTARLTATYAMLAADSNSAQSEARLARRALDHARTGSCLHSQRLCGLERLHFEDLQPAIEELRPADIEAVYVLATSWTSWIAAHANDFTALADLPRVEALLDWVAGQDPSHDDGAVWLYLAVLNSQRPPAAGGQPARARRYFEQARATSQGRNRLIDVMMADSYARLLFERELFVELLERTLNSDDDHPDYRLINALARQRAAELLTQTEALFD